MAEDSPEQVKEHPTHPNTLLALEENRAATQWKPGESGNKAGYSLKSRLDDALGKPKAEPGKDATVGELIVQATIEGAILREPTPFKEVWDRTEGKVPDKLAVNLTAGLKELISEMRGLPELPEEN